MQKEIFNYISITGMCTAHNKTNFRWLSRHRQQSHVIEMLVAIVLMLVACCFANACLAALAASCCTIHIVLKALQTCHGRQKTAARQAIRFWLGILVDSLAKLS